eukprot:TRINITY_DN7403_c0_g1_i2.p1 TRINITY_DN7403_c0_g1~~TRINITY_DN7403_c0_g1_i2.p1  ORF type:complete len:257 (-),score=36.50 TRINITY_DN7403_c0_g1_i2:79-825(-)
MKRPAATAVRRRPAVKAGAATASEPCRKRRCLLAPDAVAAAAEASECKAFQGRLDERGSEVSYRPDFVSASEAAAWLSELREKVPWEQGHVKLFGKMHPEPRLTCYYGDHGFQYTYSGRTVRPRPWDECPLVARIRRRVESATGERFNTVLCNRYRNGDDTVGWHADDEKVYGKDPTIASVSLGAVRDFDLREHDNKDGRRIRIRLASGSLLVMSGRTQHFWQHSLPRRKRLQEERINLTFRKIVAPS